MRPHRPGTGGIDSPKALRLRRLANQRASCGCAVFVVAAVVLLAAGHHRVSQWLFGDRLASRGAEIATYPLAVNIANPQVMRYDLVGIEAHTYAPNGRPIPLKEPPALTVLREREPQATVGHVDRLVMRYDWHRRCYAANWPVPWNASAGDYVVDVRCHIPQPEAWQWGLNVRVPALPKGAKKDDRWSECVARTRVIVAARRPPDLGHGLCIATWEDPPPNGNLRRPDGSMGDWKALFDWAEFVGADAVWCRGAATQVSRGVNLSMQQPFVTDEDGINRVAHEAHRRGLKFGTWAMAFATQPRTSNAGKPPYKYAQIVGKDGSSRDTDFISLLDRDRPKHLAAWLHRMAENSDIDMVGLDYFRPDRGGYEAADDFLRLMPLTLPPELAAMSLAQRRGFVADMIERQWRKEPDFYDEWKWYQSHLVALRLRDIAAHADLKTKPLWVFTFGWLHGLQSGQDPLMMTDAGADALAVMLYQLTSVAHYNLMVTQWSKYVAAGQANLLPGDTVDFGLHQKLTRPVAAPEEMNRRIVTAALSFCKDGAQTGAFWHDISRAIRGNVGPYPGREWALAGAAAFSTVRRAWQVYPLTADVAIPASAPVGTAFEVRLTIKNLTRQPLKGLTLKLEETPDLEPIDKRDKTLAEVAAGGEAVIPWQVRIKAHDRPRGDRFMVACRVNWPDAEFLAPVRRDLPRVIVAMKYLNGS